MCVCWRDCEYACSGIIIIIIIIMVIVCGRSVCVCVGVTVNTHVCEGMMIITDISKRSAYQKYFNSPRHVQK